MSRSVYDNNPNNIHVGDPLPPDCVAPNCVSAVSDGTYPYVWNNDQADASFGITSKMFLDQITTAGTLIDSLEVPNSSQRGVPPTKDQLVTSFPSKSEIALNLTFRPPFSVHTVAKTDSTNLRLYWHVGEVIFNWEVSIRRLKVHDPETGHRIAPRTEERRSQYGSYEVPGRALSCFLCSSCFCFFTCCRLPLSLSFLPPLSPMPAPVSLSMTRDGE